MLRKTTLTCLRDPQRGSSLQLALIALMIGTLIAFPLMYHVRSVLAVEHVVQQATREQYAADAAVEFALWRLTNDSSWSEAVAASGSVGVETTVPGAINRMQASARVAKVTHRFHYALFGGSETCNSVMEWTGAHNRLIGDAHSNRGIRIQGADTIITGTVSYVTDAPSSDKITYYPPPPDNPVRTYAQSLPVLFSLADYSDPSVEGSAAYYAAQEGRYHYVEGDWQVNESGTVFDGLYYVTGDLKLNGNSMSGTATFVSRQTIELVGSGFQFQPYVDSLSLFSGGELTGPSRCNTPLIKIAGSGICSVGGYVYAPYGLIRVSGSGGLAGAFIGDSVDLAGAGLTVEVPPPTSSADGCSVYDILATAGDTRTHVRVRICDDGNMSILTWQLLGKGY